MLALITTTTAPATIINSTTTITIDGAASNKQHGTSLNTAKLDRETEELKHEKVTVDVGHLIQKGRQSKGWTQKDLATVSLTVLLAGICKMCTCILT